MDDKVRYATDGVFDMSRDGRETVWTSRHTRGTWEWTVREGEDVYYLELSAVTFVDVDGAGVLADVPRRLEPGRCTVPHRPPPVPCRAGETFRPGMPGIEVPTP